MRYLGTLIWVIIWFRPINCPTCNTLLVCISASYFYSTTALPAQSASHPFVVAYLSNTMVACSACTEQNEWNIHLPIRGNVVVYVVLTAEPRIISLLLLFIIYFLRLLLIGPVFLASLTQQPRWVFKRNKVLTYSTKWDLFSDIS